MFTTVPTKHLNFCLAFSPRVFPISFIKSVSKLEAVAQAAENKPPQYTRQSQDDLPRRAAS